MFKYDTENSQPLVTVTLDGKQISLPTGMNVAAALLGIGEIVSRISPSSHKPCSPHCLMGVCYECLMEIDGIKRQACMTDVAEGMVINRYLNSDSTNKHIDSTNEHAKSTTKNLESTTKSVDSTIEGGAA
jgi:predicted molibdopterin-dependent oxidoreductase YjgC